MRLHCAPPLYREWERFKPSQERQPTKDNLAPTELVPFRAWRLQRLGPLVGPYTLNPKP